MRLRTRGLLLLSFSAPLWLIPVFLACENWERQRNRLSVEFAVSPRVRQAEEQDGKIYHETAFRAQHPPAALAAAYPVLEKLDGAKEAEYANLAQEWGALILDCDTEGQIERQFAAAHPPSITSLAAKAAGLDHLDKLVSSPEEFYRQDAADQLRRMVQLWRLEGRGNEYQIGGRYCTHYKIPVESDPEAGYQFMIHPMRDEDTGRESAAVVILPWRWAKYCQKYRPNCYLRDWYIEYEESEWWTNSVGFRDEEVTLPKPAGCYRIVCIGGSTTVEGARNDLTYPNELERLLRAYLDTEAVEVINCGVDAHTFGMTRSYFQDYLALEPDMILFYNFVNDAMFVIDDAFSHTVASNRLKHAVFGTLCRSFFFSRHFQPLRSLFMPGEEDYLEAVLRHPIPVIEEMRAEAAAQDIRFAAASFAYPDFENLPPEEQAWFRYVFGLAQIVRPEFEDYVLAVRAFNTRLREYCQEKGVAYVPVGEELKGGVAVYTDFAHMHTVGILRKGEIMFEHLKEVVARDMK